VQPGLVMQEGCPLSHLSKWCTVVTPCNARHTGAVSKTIGWGGRGQLPAGFSSARAMCRKPPTSRPPQVSCCHYLGEPDDAAVLTTAHTIYGRMGKWTDAMRVALMLNDRALVDSTWSSCLDSLERRQIGYLLARQVGDDDGRGVTWCGCG